MKEITFIRHAKSSWEYDLPDIKRPLKNRGINDASLVSTEFLNYSLLPEIIFTSPAVRARMTCDIFIKKLNYDLNNVKIVDDLYDFSGSSVLNFIRQIGDKYNSVMIFGHNHAFTSIANSFGSIYLDNVPTSGLFKIDFEIESWNQLNQGKTSLIIFPRDLK